MRRCEQAVRGQRAGSAGFALLAAILAAMLVALAALGTQVVLRFEREREREAQLLAVGLQFDAAIRSYYARTPGGVGEYPRELADLLEDLRGPLPARHLRRIFVDPATGSDRWGLVRHGDRIVGVHSLSQRAPIRHAGFPKGYERFEKAQRLSDWVFGPPLPEPAQTAPQAAS